MQQIKNVKQSVAVNVTIASDGQVRPKKFLWKDGIWYKIDRVVHAERAVKKKEPLPEKAKKAADQKGADTVFKAGRFF